MTFDCLVHVHSSFSYDSKTDLADIAATARRHGIRCVLMSDHNNKMNQGQVDDLVRRCTELSDDDLLIVPGLELAFDSNRVHLLAFGLRRYLDSMTANCTFQSLVAAVREAGGIAVLAHPSHKQAMDRLTMSDLGSLDGIEVWNVKNGNRFVPMPSELHLLDRVRRAGGRAVAFGGLDWHHLSRFTRFTLRVEAAEVTEAAVFSALRAGHFHICGAYTTVPAQGETSAARLLFYRGASTALKQVRRTAYRWQSAVERRGLKLPRLLTAVGRRFF